MYNFIRWCSLQHEFIRTFSDHFRPWWSMSVTENSSLLFSFCHLVLVFSKNCFLACYFDKEQSKDQMFFKITRSRWQKENNRLLFSVTGTDDQGLRKELRLEALFSSEVRIYKQCFFTDKLKSYWCTPLLFPTTTCEKYISSCCLSTKPIHSGTKWVFVHSCCASNWTKNAVKTYNF